jgi:site-specific DNA recombinase
MTGMVAERAAIYIRVSSARQEDGSSLETQEQGCRQYAEEHGYQVAGVYREVFTGVELWERPQLTALRDAVRRRDVGAVAAYAIDRLARDPVHLGVVLSEAENAGVDVLFVTEPLDGSPEGQLIRFVRGYAAKIEHMKIVERTQRGKRARAESGKLLAGNKALYGYQWASADKGAYTVDALTAPIVERIFRDALAGKTLRRIAAELTAASIPSPRRTALWDQSTVQRILRNSMYVGIAAAFRLKYDKPSKERKREGVRYHITERPSEDQIALPAGTVPAIIDADTFAAVQEKLVLNQQWASRSSRYPEVALLRAGFVRCGHCGGAMRVAQQRGGFRYACIKGGRHTERCTGHGITAGILDTAVWDAVVEVLSDPAIIERELENLNAKGADAKSLDAIDRKIAEIERRRANAARGYAALADDEATAAPLLTELRALAAQIKQLREDRDAQQSQDDQRRYARKQLKNVQEWLGTVASRLDSLDYHQRRQALYALNVQATVYRSGHVPRYEVTAGIPLDDFSGLVVLRSNR